MTPGEKKKSGEQMKETFHLKVMNPDRMVYEGDVSNVFIQGDTGEFEMLPYHYPIFSLLKEGEIIINWEKKIKVRKGIVRFFKNDCVIIVELQSDTQLVTGRLSK